MSAPRRRYTDPFFAKVSPALLRAFAYIVARPDTWHEVDDLAKGSGASRATIYRRFGNLVAAGVLSARRPVGGSTQFKLRPDWQACQLACDLYRRSMAAEASK